MVMGLDELKSALIILASPADEQIRYLTEIGHKGVYEELGNIDELALQFADEEYIIPEMVSLGYINSNAESSLGDLTSRLRELSSSAHAAFWTKRALVKDARWEQIRQLAHLCLRQLAS
jgi:hypothetical protein